jgi:MFS family permease
MRGKWTVLAFLCVLFVVYTIDRALLGLLAIPIQNETGMSNVRFGILSSGIFWSYALIAPFAGLAGDRFDRKRLIAFAVIGWSAMTFLAGFADGFWSLFALVSFAIVIPQTLYSPAASALIASLHAETRTMAMSCHQAAFYTGWFVSGAVVAGLSALSGGWRSVFWVMGAIGVVLGVVFLSVAGIGKGSETNEYGKNRRPTVRESLHAFWGCPSALLAGLGYVAVVFVSCGYGAWGPKFIAQKFGMSAAAAGTGVMFWHYAASFAAILIAGFVTDRFVERFPRFRLGMAVSAFVLAIPTLFLFSFGETPVIAFAGAALLGVMWGVLGANQFTNLFDVIRSEFRAGAIGFLNVVAGLVGSLSPMFLGWLSQKYGVRGFEIGFSAMGIMLLVPVLALLISFFITFRKDRVIEG